MTAGVYTQDLTLGKKAKGKAGKIIVSSQFVCIVYTYTQHECENCHVLYICVHMYVHTCMNTEQYMCIGGSNGDIRTYVGTYVKMASTGLNIVLSCIDLLLSSTFYYYFPMSSFTGES